MLDQIKNALHSKTSLSFECEILLSSFLFIYFFKEICQFLSLIGVSLCSSDCSYTCHLECERRVQLDCNQRDKEPKRTTSPRGQRSSSLSSSSSSSSATPLHKVRVANQK